MTINISGKSKANILVYKHEQEGVKGYIFQVVNNSPIFVEEDEADKLARYMLFSDKDE